MDKAFDQVVTSLDALAASIIAISPTDVNALNVTHGWYMPGLTLADIASYASRLGQDIRELAADKVTTADAVALAAISTEIDQVRSVTVPQFWGGNGGQAIPAYLLTIEGIRRKLARLMPKTVPVLAGSLPSRQARRIARLNAEIDAVVVDRDALAIRMQQINEAHETAESLPEDLASLKEARAEVARLAADAQRDASDIDSQKEAAGRALTAMNLANEEAQKLIAQAEEAYRSNTTKGLAGAFDTRAKGLSTSMQLWVGALVVALVAAAFLGGQRVDVLTKNLGAPDPQWGVIWLNFALSLLSVGAPLWFAWVATKQIGQRFRLAEDYGYKASIAKAYEGYRREAAKLDPEFSARLFGSSLSRLEEAPLRLMEESSHGSPLHELLNSRRAQDALATVPALREKALELATDIQQAMLSKRSKLTSGIDPSIK